MSMREKIKLPSRHTHIRTRLQLCQVTFSCTQKQTLAYMEFQALDVYLCKAPKGNFIVNGAR